MPLKEKVRIGLEKKQSEQKIQWSDYRAGKGKKPAYATGVLSQPEEHYDKFFGVKPKQSKNKK